LAILRKIKREATPPTSPTQVASHFILPQRTCEHFTNEKAKHGIYIYKFADHK
jgi:hypothetical protein